MADLIPESKTAPHQPQPAPIPIITASQALSLVQSYFGYEWRVTPLSEVSLRPVLGGFVNRLHLLTRHTSAVQEPALVLIRHFNTQGLPADPPASDTTLSAAEQAIVYHEMGKRGWGPKLYGVFHGGRLEEWIDAHPLTAEESTDPVIRRDIARSYARLHGLDLPLRRGRFRFVVDELKGIAVRIDGLVPTMLASLDEQIVGFAEVARGMEWTIELDWVSSLFEKHQCRTAFVVGDTNYLNVLVKKYDSECRVMLIDYETLSHGYRGFDLGGHFNERMYCWNRPGNVITGYSAADVVEQKKFFEAYLQELGRSEGRLGPSDTIEQLSLEAKIGRMFHILFSAIMCFLDEPSEDPAMYAGLTHMLNVYGLLKKDFG